MIRIAGGEPLFGTTGEHSPWATLDAFAAADPDRIIIFPCGFDLARTRAEVGTLAAQPEFAALRAVRSGQAFVADGNAYFNRPGPRLVESLEILAEIIHPTRFDFRHRGAGYEAL